MTTAATLRSVAPPRSGRTVLVVDDEPTIAEVVARYLERAGYETATAGDGLEALRLAAERRPDLIVLDLMLPGLGGLEVLRQLGESDAPRTPVIVLTAKGEQDDKLVGLGSGADDYVVKPFSPSELVARVDAVLRRVLPDGDDAEPLRFDGLEIDVPACQVQACGEEAQLSQREFDLLQFLATHPGRVFSRYQLIDRVWEPAFHGDPGTVTVHVRRLRTKIEPDPERPRFIQTVWGVGYRFQP
jgi:two-component system, OmpR family, response regulator ResD